MRPARHAGIGSWALSVTLLAVPAVAGPAEEAAAEALFQKGRALMAAGEFVEACPKLAESQKLDPAVGTLLYLGECYEQNGQTASAWAAFESAAAAGRKASQVEREQMARTRAQQLLPKLSRLTIEVAAAARIPGLEVKRDGTQVGGASWGVEVPVDPGQHVVEANAPGKQPWSKTVDIGPDGSTTTVQIPLLPDKAATPPESDSMSTPDTRSAQDAGSRSAPGSTQQTVGLVIGGVGVVGLAVGTVFALQSRSKEDESEQYCRADDPSLCQQKGVDLIDEAETARTVSLTAFGLGGAALIGGAVLYLTASTGPEASAATQSSLRIVPAVGPRSTALFIQGRF